MDKLHRILKLAQKTVPYYKNFFRDNLSDIYDLNKYPIIDKKLIQQTPEDFISNLYNKSDLICASTSGSTGIPLKLYKSTNDELRSGLAECLFRLNNYGIKPTDKFCQFHLFRNENNKATSPIYVESKNNISFSIFALEDEYLQKYIDLMYNFNPIWFFATPSSLLILSNYMINNNIKPPAFLRYIEVAGEYFSEAQRIKIEEAFDCVVANHYGCTEIGAIAMECPKGNLHCLDDNVYLETNENMGYNNSCSGEFLITGLNNESMPFIRYNLGDRGIKCSYLHCDCGNSGNILEITAGRIVEYASINGHPVNSGIFYYIVEKLNEQLEVKITQFQIIQRTLNEMEVFLSVNHAENSKGIKERFVALACEMGLIHIFFKVQIVTAILPNNKTGKLQYIINKIEGST